MRAMTAAFPPGVCFRFVSVWAVNGSGSPAVSPGAAGNTGAAASPKAGMMAVASSRRGALGETQGPIHYDEPLSLVSRT